MKAKEPHVTLIEYTGKGRPDEELHAAHLLAFTKATRLKMDADLLEAVKTMPWDELAAELEYMASTIRSSWEFVDVTFLVENVSRACAQQMTRTRNASFAMQSMRVVNASGADVANSIDEDKFPVERAAFDLTALKIKKVYADFVDEGVPAQDARGLLPINTQTNLVAKYNLRAFVDLVTARKSLRTQGEYYDIVHQMEAAVIEAWPWVKPFFVSRNAQAIALLEAVVEELGLEVGNGAGWNIAKAIDLVRGA